MFVCTRMCVCMCYAKHFPFLMLCLGASFIDFQKCNENNFEIPTAHFFWHSNCCLLFCFFCCFCLCFIVYVVVGSVCALLVGSKNLKPNLPHICLFNEQTISFYYFVKWDSAIEIRERVLFGESLYKFGWYNLCLYQHNMIDR